MRARRAADDLLTRGQAADFLGISLGTVYNWIEAGLIVPVPVAGYRFTKIRRADLKELKDEARRRGVSVVHQLPRQLRAEREVSA